VSVNDGAIELDNGEEFWWCYCFATFSIYIITSTLPEIHCERQKATRPLIDFVVTLLFLSWTDCLLPFTSTTFLILSGNSKQYSVAVIHDIHKYIFHNAHINVLKQIILVRYRLPWLICTWDMVGTLPVVNTLFFTSYFFTLCYTLFISLIF